jgi:hypothetical protein
MPSHPPKYGFIGSVLARVLYQHISLRPDEFIPLIVSKFKLMSQKDCFLRAGFFTEAAKNAPDQIYLIYLCKTFAFFILGRLHIYRISRTGGGTEAAANTSFGTIIIPLKIMQPPIPRRHFGFLPRVFLGNRLSKQMLQYRKQAYRQGDNRRLYNVPERA